LSLLLHSGVPLYKRKDCIEVHSCSVYIFIYWTSYFIIYIFSNAYQAKYIVDEVKDKSDQQIDALSWKQESVENLPLQENGYFSSLFLASIVVPLFFLVQLMNPF
jgi:hypothetical protein